MMEKQYMNYSKIFKKVIKEEENLLMILNKNELSIKEILLLITLHSLTAEENNTASQLSLELNISPSVVSTTLNKLEKGGYIERVHDITDRRKVFVIPKTKSKEVKENYKDFYTSISSNLNKEFNSKDLSVFNKVLKYLEMYYS